MYVKLLREEGIKEAVFGNSLSMTKDPDMSFEDFDITAKEPVVSRLAKLDRGHNNCLEMIDVWLDVKAPRYFWQEYDTYRVGTEDNEYKMNAPKRSESTVHRIKNRELTWEDMTTPGYKYLQLNNPTLALFVKETIEAVLKPVNHIIKMWEDRSVTAKEATVAIKNMLPESFLQRRILKLNYKQLRNIYHQRSAHMLPEWEVFIDVIYDLDKPYWVIDL